MALCGPLFLLPRILCLSQYALGHPLGSALSHPRENSSITLILPCAQLAHSHKQSLVDCSIPHPWDFLPSASLPYSLGFVGRGEEASGVQASRLGVTGRWTMCLFLNSMKKPTSEIPFLFFLDLGVQLLPLTELGASASCSVDPGSQGSHIDIPFFPCTLTSSW